jgi:hypothetical protein
LDDAGDAVTDVAVTVPLDESVWPVNVTCCPFFSEDTFAAEASETVVAPLVRTVRTSPFAICA